MSIKSGVDSKDLERKREELFDTISALQFAVMKFVLFDILRSFSFSSACCL